MDLSKNGKLLYDLRKKKGFTQKQIAEKLGVVPKTVSKWEVFIKSDLTISWV